MDTSTGGITINYNTLTMHNYNHDNTLNASVITDFISSPLELTQTLASLGTGFELAAEFYQSRVM
jgi:hypothetical protein